MNALQKPRDRDGGRAEGERRRDAGIDLAARRREVLILAGQIAFLNALLSSADRRATTDDITEDLFASFPDAGKWRGSIPRGLASRGLLKKDGYRESTRAARNRGTVAVWVAADSDAALTAHRDQLQFQQRCASATEPATPTTLSSQPTLF
jgi:hypothetical protein